MSGYRPGARVRIKSPCVWPVAPPADGTYPQPASFEVLLLLDDDPLVQVPSGEWTCVIRATDVEAIS